MLKNLVVLLFFTLNVFAADTPSMPTRFNSRIDSKNEAWLFWDYPESRGCCKILDYQVSIQTPRAADFDRTYTTTNRDFKIALNFGGGTYKFKVQARNSAGLGEATNTLIEAIASPPAQPEPPQIFQQQDNVIIMWEEPWSPTHPITQYRIEIRSKSGEFETLVQYCDGSQSNIITRRSCRIPKENLMFDPFFLTYGSPLRAKVQAFNELGSSEMSAVGGSFNLIDIPILSEVRRDRTKETIALEWKFENLTPRRGLYTLQMSKLPSTRMEIVKSNMETTSFVVENLEVSQYYNFQVIFSINGQNIVVSNILQVELFVIPDAPVNLIEVPEVRSKSGMTIRWDEPAFKGGYSTVNYQVALAESRNGVFRTVQNEGANPSFVIIGVPFGSQVTARVFSINPQGKSIAFADITLLNIVEPGAPTDFTEDKAARQDTSIKVSWQEPTFDGGDSFTYSIYQQNDNGIKILIQKDIAYTETIINNLVQGEHYTFSVVAVNSFGQGEDSNRIEMQFVAEPSAPTELQMTAWDQQSVTIEWQKPAKTGGNIDKYIAILTSDDKFDEYATIMNSIVLRGLTAGQNYQLQVKAVNQDYESALSKHFHFQFLVQPDPPINIYEVIDRRIDARAYIQWDTPNFTGGSTDLTYTILMINDAQEYETLVETSENGAFVDYLREGKNYKFAVVSRNQKYESKPSNVLEIFFYTDPSLPTDYREDVSLRTADSITLLWGEPVVSGGTSGQLNYEIKQILRSTLSDVETIIVSELTETSFKVNDLELGNLYSFQIRAFNGELYTDYYSLDIKMLIQPSTPQNPSYLPEKKIVEWQEPAMFGGAVEVTYDVLLGDEVISEAQRQTFFDVTLLEQKIEHTITIRAKNSFDTSINSTPVTFIWFQTPSKPSNLQVVEHEIEDKFVLQWDAHSIDVEYTVFRQIGDQESKIIAQNLTDTQLESIYIATGEATTIKFWVQAWNEHVASSTSDVFKVQFTQKPKSPCDLQIVPRESLPNSLKLIWCERNLNSRNAEYTLKQQSLASEDTVFYRQIVDTEFVVQEIYIGQIYFFQVSVTIDGIQSKYSEILQVQHTLPPQPPTLLRELPEKRTQNSIVLTWDVPEDTGGASELRYNLVIVNEQYAAYEYLKSGIEAQEYEVTDASVPFTSGKTYQFNIQAESEYFTSYLGEPFRMTFSVAPSVVSNLRERILRRREGQFTVQWAQPLDFGGLPDIKYRVEVLLNGELIQQSNGYQTETEFTVINAQEQNQYTVKVYANNNFRDSVPAEFILNYFWVSIPNLQLSIDRTQDDLVLVWSRSEAIDAILDDIEFQTLSYDLNIDGVTIAQNMTENTIRVPRDQIQMGKQMLIKLYIKNKFGYSETVMLTATHYDVPSAPSNLREIGSDSRTGSNITIRWDLKDNGGYDEHLFYVTINDTSSVNSSELLIYDNIEESEFVFTEAVPGHKYTFTVVAFNQKGNSLPSEPLQITFVVKPSAPLNIMEIAKERTTDTTRINWEQPESNGGSSQQLVYSAFITDKRTYIIVQVSNILEQSLILTDLVIGREYEIKILAQNEQGRGPISEPYTFQMVRAPGAPNSLREIDRNRTDTSLTVWWIKPFDFGGALSVDYLVNVEDLSDSLLSFEQETSETSLQFKATLGHKYQVKVATRNGNLISEYSQPIQITFLTRADPPSTLAEIVSERTQNSTMIQWSAPLRTGGSQNLSYTIIVYNKVVGRVIFTDLIQNNLTLTNLVPGYSYQILGITHNEQFKSTYSNKLEFRFETMPSKPIVSEVISKRGADSMTLEWQILDKGSAIVLEKTVQQRILGESDWQTVGFTSNGMIELDQFNAGTTYEFIVTAANSAGQSATSDPPYKVFFMTEPEKPQNLREDRNARTNSSVTLVWDEPYHFGGADSVYYQVSLATNKTNFVLRSKSNTTSVEIENLQLGKEYYFKVQAVNEYKSSVDSDSLMVHFLQKPSGVLQLSEVTQERSLSSIQLQWQPPESLGGSEKVVYSIFQSSSGESNKTVVQNYSGTKYEVRFLQPAQTYVFMITSQNEFGQSNVVQTIEVNFITKPDPPTDLRQTENSEQAVLIEWMAPKFTGGDPNLKYDVFISEKDDSQENLLPKGVEVNTTEFVFDMVNIKPGKTFVIKIQTKNSFSSSIDSEPIEFKYLLRPSAPQALQQDYESTDEYILALQWEEPLNMGGENNMKYIVFDNTSDTTSKEVCVSQIVTRCSFNNYLKIGDAYVFSVIAINTLSQQSVESALLEFEFMLPPGAPINVRELIENRTETSVTIVWDKPQNYGDYPIKYNMYYVSFDENGEERLSFVPEDLDETRIVIHPDMGETIKFIIRAKNEIGQSPDSDIIVIRFLSKPAAPINIREIIENRTEESTVIEWSLPGDSLGGSNETEITYRINMIERSGSTTLIAKNLRQKSYTVDQLRQGWTYSFTVQIDNGFDISDQSDILNIAFLTTPAAPLDLEEVIEKRTQDSLTLTWKEPVNKGGANAVTYSLFKLVLINDTYNYTMIKTNIVQNEYTINELELGETYTFKVASKNHFNQSEMSSHEVIKFVWKPISPQNVVRGIDPDQTSSSYLFLWEVPQDITQKGGEEVDHYQVEVYDQNGAMYKSYEVENKCKLYEQLDWECDPITSQRIEDLKNDEKYGVALTAINSFSESDVTWFNFTYSDKLSKASNLREERGSRTEDSILLKWDKPEKMGNLNYEVHIHPSNSNKYSVAVGENTEAVIDQLQAGVNYIFYVVAQYDGTEAEESNHLSFIFRNTPSKVTGLRESERFKAQSEISWNKVASTGGQDFERITYRLNVYNASSDEDQPVPIDTQETYETSVMTDGVLIAGFKYWFTVVAINEGFYISEPSERLELVFIIEPGKIDNIYEVSRSKDSFTLGWGKVSDDGGDPEGVFYQVLYRKLTQQYESLIPVATNLKQTSVTIPNLEQGEKYEVMVLVDNSKYSVPSKPFTFEIGRQAKAPINVKIEYLTKDTIIIDWDKDLDSNSFDVYNVEVFDKSEEWKDITQECQMFGSECRLNMNTLTVGYGFTIGDQVCVQVQTANEYGLSPFSEKACANDIIRDKPNKPESLTLSIEDVKVSQVKLSWQPPAQKGGFQNVLYSIYYKDIEANSEFQPIAHFIESNHYTVNSLEIGKRYSFKVRAVNLQGQSLDSNIEDFTAKYPPNAPSNISVNNTAQGDIVIKWQNLNTSETNGADIKSYTILIQQSDLIYDEIVSDYRTCLLDDSEYCEYSIQQETLKEQYGFKPGQQVCFELQARNEVGYSPRSISQCDKNLIWSSASPVLKLKQVKDGEIDFTWEANPETCGDVVYIVYYDEASGFEDFKKQLNNFKSTDTKLNSNMTDVTFLDGLIYTFWVKAENPIGPSDFSPPLVIRKSTKKNAAKKLEENYEPGNTDFELNWEKSASTMNASEDLAGELEYEVFVAGENVESLEILNETAVTQSEEDLANVGGDESSEETNDSGRLLWSKTDFKSLARQLKRTNGKIRGIKPGSKYTFLVQTKFKTKKGDESTVAVAEGLTLDTAVKPEPPRFLRQGKDDDSNFITLEWLMPEYDGGIPIQDFQIDWDAGKGDEFTPLEKEIKALSYRIQFLESGKYNFKVRARNQKGLSESSNLLRVKVAQKVNPEYNDGELISNSVATSDSHSSSYDPVVQESKTIEEYLIVIIVVGCVLVLSIFCIGLVLVSKYCLNKEATAELNNRQTYVTETNRDLYTERDSQTERTPPNHQEIDMAAIRPQLSDSDDFRCEKSDTI